MTGESVVTALERTYYYENYYYLITNNIQQLFISRMDLGMGDSS